MWKLFSILIKIFHAVRSYFETSSLHGFRFIAEPGRHYCERLLWTFLCIISWIGSGVLISASYDAFLNNAVSFVVETTYLDTNVSFPAVSVCEEENLQPVYEAATKLFGENHDCNLDEILRELTYFKGSAYYMKEFCFTGEIDCPKGNFSQLVNSVRGKCEDILVECSWHGTPFECCKHFVKIETELGPCFTFSSLNERKLRDRGEPDAIETVASRDRPLPSLKFEINGTTKVYMHSEFDVPYMNILSSDTILPELDLIKSYYVTVTDIENPPEVRGLSIFQRKCRFADENDMKSADYYSYAACVVDCRRQAQMDLCNCTSHFTPKSTYKEQCDVEGILCLYQHYEHLSVQRTKWGDKNGLVCDCLPSCSDPEYNIITTGQDVMSYERNTSVIEIKLMRFASERYKRNVVRERLDLVVSMGSAAGLFVGASLLSFVEAIYFFLFRSRSKQELDKSATSDDIEPTSETQESTKQQPINQDLPPFFL